MKFLLVLAVVLVAFWIWRNNRLNERPGAPPPRGPGKPVAMVACDHCGTHLPEAEVVRGQQGVYCCQEHRRQNEGASP
ncbi:PP0621 family protein [Hydrogenophaga sp. SL48]|uniref:PP0621 family protein n=1 Tax=Hydrogenophaga sp. SL48 TaxID=2806347 RepID=UPI001F28655B|nr:PP0621 family protein [Hydrogenophaga sp. SL48]UJW79698.1 hypothetical protein IM738_17680 [Hydrogenophaga sp. SL48]